MKTRRLPAALAAIALATGALAVAGCGSSDDSGDTTGGGGGSDLSGKIVVDGSSTVAPLTSAAAEGFNGENSGVDIEVRTSGTGGGFEVFCKGETDISDASREIKDEEAAACKSAGVEYQAFRVASDGITNVLGQESDIGKDCLTIQQLGKIWAPRSTINNWQQVGPGFNDLKLTLAGPGSQSGTYDFFNEEVLGEDAQGEVIQPRQDYAASEDDNVTVRAVQDTPGALGYFGYSYYEENSDTLKALSLDAGEGCVAPTPETITSGQYPLSRPLYIYVSKKALERAEVKAFVQYYIQNAIALANELKFVPAPQSSIDEDLQTLGS